MLSLVIFTLLLFICLFAGALICEAWLYSGEQQAKFPHSDRS